MNGATTRYGLDPAAGLTQVLSDGTSTYLYGTGRIAQQQTHMHAFSSFGADGLGSVRQFYNASGQVVANTRYELYGNVLSQSGVGTSAYGFTGEWTDSYINLLFLRARWYDYSTGRFRTRDVWEGDVYRAQSLNGFTFVTNNPTNRTDPSGFDGDVCIPGAATYLSLIFLGHLTTASPRYPRSE